MDPARARLLRQLPQVDELLRHPHLSLAVASLPRPLAAAAVRRGLAEQRQFLSACPAADLPPELDLDRSVAGTPENPGGRRADLFAPGAQRHRGGDPHQSGTLPSGRASPGANPRGGAPL